MKATRHILFLLLIAFAAPATGAPILTVEPASSTPAPGASFSLQIAISGAVDLISYQFDIGYNPLILNATSITFGPFLQTGGSTVTALGGINNSAGLIDSISEVLISGSVTGNGTLATIAFSAVSAGTTGIAISNPILFDESLAGLTVTVSNGSVTVADTTAVPEPSTMLCAAVLAGLIVVSRVRRRRAGGMN